MKIIKLFITVLMVMSLAIGCANRPSEVPDEGKAFQVETKNEEQSQQETPVEDGMTAPSSIRIRAIAPEGATTIAMLKMIHDQTMLMDRAEVTYESLNTTDLLVSELVGEKTDFAIAPTNLAAKLYNKGIPYQLVSVNTHGNLYVVTSKDLHTWDDLKGEEVYMIGQGLVPDLIFRYLAEANGVVPDEDFTITYLAGASEVAATYLSGKATIIMMPEPVLSVVKTKTDLLHILFDIQAEYENVTGAKTGFPQAGLLVKNELIETEPEVVAAFIQGIQDSCSWVNENPETAAEYITELDLGIPEPVAINAIPGLNIEHVSIEESREELETLFNILMLSSPDSIGGKVPDESFYFKSE
jgi:NitT/TauT family transport system substrate-binding protein